MVGMAASKPDPAFEAVDQILLELGSMRIMELLC